MAPLFERSYVPGLPTSRSTPADPIQRLEQLLSLLTKTSPPGLSRAVLQILHEETLRDYRSILREVHSYVRLQMRLHLECMAQSKAWDLDDVLYLYWRAWPGLLKLYGAPWAPRWMAGPLITSAQVDLSTFASPKISSFR